jgi:Co/Zn/Cd efflux system component
VVAGWSVSLIRATGAVLLDLSSDPGLARKIVERLERNGDRISDLHLWRVGPGHVAGIVSIVAETPQEPAHYKSRLADLSVLSHLTVEVERCPSVHQH